MIASKETMSALEMKIYDMVFVAGEHGIGVGTVVARLGSGGATAKAIASLLKTGALEREDTRLFAI